MIELLAYPPVLRGLILVAISGFTLPLSGVFILRMNLLPIRFLMIHGVFLGGALGLALGWDPSLTSLVVNLGLIVLLNRSSKILKGDYGHLSVFFMIAAIAAAAVIISRFNLPARDTLTLLWGSLYANHRGSLIFAAVLGAGMTAFWVFFFRQLTAIFFDRDTAASLGIPVNVFELLIMFLIALVVASAMRLMGALLLDALILLPGIIAGLFASGLRRMLILSSLFGGLFAVGGFFISLLLDIPVSAGTSLPGAVIFLFVLIARRGLSR